MVVSGLIRGGSVKVNQVALLGPDKNKCIKNIISY